MRLAEQEIHALASLLDEAQRQNRLIPKFTEEHPRISIEDAYRIQRELQRLKQLRGQKLVGYKMGLTSPAKMKQIGIDSPVFGFLTDDYRREDGMPIDMAGLVQPRAEPEIAFITSREIAGKNCTAELDTFRYGIRYVRDRGARTPRLPGSRSIWFVELRTMRQPRILWFLIQNRCAVCRLGKTSGGGGKKRTRSRGGNRRQCSGRPAAQRSDARGYVECRGPHFACGIHRPFRGNH